MEPKIGFSLRKIFLSKFSRSGFGKYRPIRRLEIWDLIESVSEDFPTNSFKSGGVANFRYFAEGRANLKKNLDFGAKVSGANSDSSEKTA